MLYTDGTYLIADDLQELYDYAQKMKLQWDWLHQGNNNFHPHFDIVGEVRKRVLADNSVKQVSTREIVRLAKINYRVPTTDEEIQAWEEHHGKKLELPLPTDSDYDRMIKNIKKQTGL